MANVLKEGCQRFSSRTGGSWSGFPGVRAGQRCCRACFRSTVVREMDGDHPRGAGICSQAPSNSGRGCSRSQCHLRGDLPCPAAEPATAQHPNPDSKPCSSPVMKARLAPFTGRSSGKTGLCSSRWDCCSFWGTLAWASLNAVPVPGGWNRPGGSLLWPSWSRCFWDRVVHADGKPGRLAHELDDHPLVRAARPHRLAGFHALLAAGAFIVLLVTAWVPISTGSPSGWITSI